MLIDGSPKYLAISLVLETLIRQGHWKDGSALSARRIAEDHRVSVVTASRALQVLRDRGLIQTVDRQGSFVASSKTLTEVRQKWAICLRVTPGPWYQASLANSRSGFQQLGRRHGLVFDTETFEDDGSIVRPDLEKRIRRAMANGLAGLFFLPSRLSDESTRADEKTLEACRLAGLPVVLIERNLRGPGRSIDYDVIACDDVDGGFQCTRHLIDQGRRRVAFLTGSPTSSHEGRLAGYLRELYQEAAVGNRPCEPLVFEQSAVLPIKIAYQQLADRIVKERVDGVVCFQDYTAIGLILELLTRGVHIPRDVALTGFDDIPIGDSFALGLTTYAPPPDAVAEEALHAMGRRISHPDAARVKILVPGRLIVRESSRPITESSEKP